MNNHVPIAINHHRGHPIASIAQTWLMPFPRKCEDESHQRDNPKVVARDASAGTARRSPNAGDDVRHEYRKHERDPDLKDGREHGAADR
jgi:hypothetical protein